LSKYLLKNREPGKIREHVLQQLHIYFPLEAISPKHQVIKRKIKSRKEREKQYSLYILFTPILLGID